MNLNFNNWNLPSPEKFQKIKKVISILTTGIVGFLAISNPADSLTLLYVKLGQSLLMELLDTLAA